MDMHYILPSPLLIYHFITFQDWGFYREGLMHLQSLRIKQYFLYVFYREKHKEKIFGAKKDRARETSSVKETISVVE